MKTLQMQILADIKRVYRTKAIRNSLNFLIEFPKISEYQN